MVHGSEFEIKECRCLFRVREIRGGSLSPVREGVTGNPELAAEVHCAALVILKVPDGAGLLFIGAACA